MDEEQEFKGPLAPQSPGAAEEGADQEAMKKASMPRKDRNLYQSILNRQKAKRQRVARLEAKRDSLKGGA